MHKWRWNGKYY